MLEAGTSSPDADLVARARHGDTEAYASLVERYQSSAIRLATLVTRDPSEAEDVAQNAFIKAYYALDRFNPELSFRAWLLRIVVNEARNSRSAAVRRTDLHSRFSAEVAGDIARSACSAEESAVANEQRDALLMAVENLRDDDRAVLAFRYLFAMSEAEMAQALGCQPGTVKSRLSRALARLRESLGRVAPLVVIPVDAGPWLSHGLSNAAGAGGVERPEFASALVAHTGTRPSLQHVTGALAGAGVVIAAVATIGLVLSAQLPPVNQVPPTASTAATSAESSASPAPVAAPSSPSASSSTPPPSSPSSASSPSASSAAAPASSGSPPSAAAASPGGVVEYGGDLSDAQHAELQQLFGTAADGLPTEVVTRPQLVAALQSAGLPLDGSERAISSALVTCQAPGSGLHVHTQNITDVPAAAYANALVTAGIADTSVLVAAPPSSPMTGETALVGSLHALSACQTGQPLDATHEQLAYRQLQVMGELAASNSNWEHAAAALLQATRSAITSPTTDQSAIGAQLDASVAAEGIGEPPGWHGAAVALLAQVASVDHGAYASGYTLQQLDLTDVWVH